MPWLVISLLGLAALYCLATWLAGDDEEHPEPPARRRPPRATPIDYEKEIAQSGPEQRQRIPGGRV